MNRRVVGLVVAAVLLAGCSFQNKYEREAQAVTQAVLNNDLRPVQNDIAPGIAITRVQIAEWSDQLNAQGTLKSVVERPKSCPVGIHCFLVTLTKGSDIEQMRLDENDKIVGWRFHPVAVSAAAK